MEQSQGGVADNNSDDLLLRRLRGGDYEAVEELYNRYSRITFALALRLLSDPGGAEDIVQEVFLKIWRNPDSFDPNRGRFASWLMSVVHNQCIDQLRKKRHTNVSLDQEETQEHLNYLVDNKPAPEEEVWIKMRRDLVRQVLNQLPQEQRRLIDLAFFGGYTHQEIATQTGQPLGTVKSRIRQGLLKLKSLLEKTQLENNLQ